MTNQRTERSRPGSPPGRRGSGVGGRAWLSLWAFALLLAAGSPARAAEVVEVRIGRHPDFTRVVFELDRAAGYRIERSAPSAQESELIVSLEAASIPRRIQSSKSFIEQVVVEPSGTRSVARIRLAREGLRLKEMILASPPRIVLDVIAEPGVAAREATKAAPATAAKTVAPTPATTAAAVKPAATVAKAEAGAPTPATTAKPAPTPTPTTALAANGGAAATAKPMTPAPESKLLASTEKPGAAATAANAKADAPSAPTPSRSESAAAGESLAARSETESAAAPSEWNDGGKAGAADAAAGGGQPRASGAARPTAAAPEVPPARPMVVKSSEQDEGGEGGGLMTWALAGLALALAAFGGLVVARRRAAAAAEEGADEEEAASPFGGRDTLSLGEQGEEEETEADERSSASLASNPFAGLSGAESPKPAPPREISKPPRAADTAEKKPSESLLFDDTEEKTMEGMEVISRSQAGESLGGAMPMMGGASDELQQMFREMQRRVAALESRIDELVDARDRLERQVAAQTEELRVQRAAIARTQRAVRNLARPEEAGDDEPTEPALRDPS